MDVKWRYGDGEQGGREGGRRGGGDRVAARRRESRIMNNSEREGFRLAAFAHFDDTETEFATCS